MLHFIGYISCSVLNKQSLLWFPRMWRTYIKSTKPWGFRAPIKRAVKIFVLSDKEGTNAFLKRVNVLKKNVMGAKKETKNGLRMWHETEWWGWEILEMRKTVSGHEWECKCEWERGRLMLQSSYLAWLLCRTLVYVATLVLLKWWPPS